MTAGLQGSARLPPALADFGRGRKPRATRAGIYFRLLVLLAALSAFAALAWMALLPVVVTNQLRTRTGFEVTVTSLSCNPFAGRLTLRGLVLTNPRTFPTGEFVQLREFHAVGDLLSFYSGRITLDELVLDVRKVALVRRADGRSNAELFEQNLGLIAAAPTADANAGAGTRPPTSEKSAAPGASGAERPVATKVEPRKFLIRRLTLRFDQLSLADYSGPKPDLREYRLALDQRYENVTDAKQLLVPDVLRRVAAENLGPVLARFVPGDFGRALGEAARGAALTGEALLKDAGTQATDLLRGLREKLEETKKP